jgi:phosphatidylglycerophosphate synthase
MNDKSDRRPLTSRDAGWARALTRRLAATAITPNQISIASMGFAAIAGAAFWAAGMAEGPSRIALLIVAAIGCQLRLICNLMDGLVAIEGGKHAPDGPFWNEAPDRVADILILVGAGLGIGWPALGWAAASLAVLTAYIRELGRANGLPADFSGPMAKPQRMALMTAAGLLMIGEPLWQGDGEVLTFALTVVVAGAALTAVRRAWRMVALLNKGI